MHKAFKLGLLALGLGIALDILFYDQDLGLNVALASLLFIGTTYLAMYIGDHKMPVRAHIAAVFAFLFAVPYAIGTSEQMYMVATLGFLASHLLFAAFAIGHEARFNHPLAVLWSGTVALGLKLFGRIDFFSKMKPPALSQKNWAVGKGLLVLIPLLAIFIALFAAADPIFKSYFTNLGDWLETWTKPEDILAQLVIIAVFFVSSALFFAAAAYERYAHQPHTERESSWVVESKIILAGLTLLFAGFLIVQGSVMFGGSAAFDRIDLTYAQYAREGFGQLITASILVAALVLTLRDRHGVKTDSTLTLLHGAFIVETLLVLVSASMRLNLYIQAYGYTSERLFAYWAIITIGILLTLLLANVLLRESQITLMNRALIVLGICALVFCYSMPDAMATRMNFRRAEADVAIDFYAMYYSSPEVTPVIIKGFQQKRAIQNEYIGNNNALNALRAWFERDIKPDEVTDSKYDGKGEPPTRKKYDWRSWNYSRVREHDLLPAPVPEWLLEATKRVDIE